MNHWCAVWKRMGEKHVLVRGVDRHERQIDRGEASRACLEGAHPGFRKRSRSKCMNPSLMAVGEESSLAVFLFMCSLFDCLYSSSPVLIVCNFLTLILCLNSNPSLCYKSLLQFILVLITLHSPPPPSYFFSIYVSCP